MLTSNVRPKLSLVFTVIVFQSVYVSRVLAEQREYFLFVAVGLPDAVTTEFKTELTNLVRDKANGGDTIYVVSTPSHELVAKLSVPNAEGRQRFRDRNLIAGFRKIGARLSKSITEPTSQLQLGLPQVTETISGLRNATGPVKIALFGDPVFFSTTPALRPWSMRDERYPSDACVISESPFYTANSIDTDADISWHTVSSQWSDSRKHREQLTRFYKLFFQQQLNGRLLRMTTDTASVFNIAADNGYRAVEPANDPFVGMYTVNQPQPADPPSIAVISSPPSTATESSEAEHDELPNSQLRNEQLEQQLADLDNALTRESNANQQLRELVDMTNANVSQLNAQLKNEQLTNDHRENWMADQTKRFSSLIELSVAQKANYERLVEEMRVGKLERQRLVEHQQLENERLQNAYAVQTDQINALRQKIVDTQKHHAAEIAKLHDSIADFKATYKKPKPVAVTKPTVAPQATINNMQTYPRRCYRYAN